MNIISIIVATAMLIASIWAFFWVGIVWAGILAVGAIASGLFGFFFKRER